MDHPEYSSYLPGPVRRLRQAAAARSAPPEIRERLLDEFAVLHGRPQAWPRWSLMAAAAALMAVALALSWRLAPQSNNLQARSAQSGWEQLAGPGDGEFIPVPYAPPLAPGEAVAVVRTQLDTQALDRMGVNVVLASAASAQVNADLVLGQDGLPRAVRVLQQY